MSLTCGETYVSAVQYYNTASTRTSDLTEITARDATYKAPLPRHTAANHSGTLHSIAATAFARTIGKEKGQTQASPTASTAEALHASHPTRTYTKKNDGTDAYTTTLQI